LRRSAGDQKSRFGSTTPQPKPDNNSDASIWRDTALRYGGYADEVGEFLSPYLGGLGKFLGYGISTVYCMSDMGTSIPKKYMNAPSEMSTAQRAKKTAAEGADLSAFHLFATLLIPPKIIGAVVQSVERGLNKEALKEAEDELIKAGEKISETGSFMEKTSHQFSLLKLKAEKSLGNLLGPTMENMIEKAAETRLMASAHQHTNTAIAKFGPTASKFVSANAWMAQKYDKFMKFNAFKDPDMPEQLQKNADSLKNPGKNFLSKKGVTRLILMKPWPVLVGIGMVPLIAHPFDKMWLKVQDWTIRPLLGKNKIIRSPEGKLQSIHNPEFWGKAAAPAQSSSAPGKPANHVAAQQGDYSSPAIQSAPPLQNELQPQALPYLEFGAFHPSNRPTPWAYNYPGVTQPILPLPFPMNPMTLPTPLMQPKPINGFNTGYSQSF